MNMDIDINNKRKQVDNDDFKKLLGIYNKKQKKQPISSSLQMNFSQDFSQYSQNEMPNNSSVFFQNNENENNNENNYEINDEDENEVDYIIFPNGEKINFEYLAITPDNLIIVKDKISEDYPVDTILLPDDTVKFPNGLTMNSDKSIDYGTITENMDGTIIINTDLNEIETIYPDDTIIVNNDKYDANNDDVLSPDDEEVAIPVDKQDQDLYNDRKISEYLIQKIMELKSELRILIENQDKFKESIKNMLDLDACFKHSIEDTLVIFKNNLNNELGIDIENVNVNDLNIITFEHLLDIYYYYSARMSPLLNNTFIVNVNHKTTLNNFNGVNGIFSRSNISKSTFSFIDIYPQSTIIYCLDNNNVEIRLYEFFYMTDFGDSQIGTFNNLFNGKGEDQELITCNFSELAFMPWSNHPKKAGIEYIFKKLGIMQNVKSKLNNYIQIFNKQLGPNKDIAIWNPCKIFDEYVKMINYYDTDFFITNIDFQNGGSLNKSDSQGICNYKLNNDGDLEYNAFSNIMNSGEPTDLRDGLFSLNKFKKYFENYIVNYCTETMPSLKMVSFLKISQLNKFMVNNNWGVVDVAGGSLFNFLDSANVVTADYDFKIYFFEHNEKEIRKAFIKCWFINVSHKINEYMRKKNFLNVTMSGKIGENINFIVKQTNKRPFVSRGKEPNLFKVPLYSDDLLFEIVFSYYGLNSEFCKKTIKLNVSYFDLVFKNFNDHYLKPYINEEFVIGIQNNIRIGQLDTYNLRIPTFFEIFMDVFNLCFDVEFKLGRIVTNKIGKDMKRLKILIDIINNNFLKNNSIVDSNPNDPDNPMYDPNDIISKIPLFIDGALILSMPSDNNRLNDIQTCYYQTNIINSLNYFNTIKQKLTPLKSSKTNIPKFKSVSSIYSEIIDILNNSFTTKFDEIVKIYWSFLLFTKKYTEFKAASDIDRICGKTQVCKATFELDISQFPTIEPITNIGESPTLDKIKEKLSLSKRNPMNIRTSYADIEIFHKQYIKANGGYQKRTKKYVKSKHSKKNIKSKKNKNHQNKNKKNQKSKKNIKPKRIHKNTNKR